MDTAAPSTSPAAARPTRGERVRESLENGELLIAFAARNALKPHDLEEAELDALVVNIAEARKSFDSGNLDSPAEAKLLNDLRHLAIAFLPVTAASIRDSSSEGAVAGRRYFFWGVWISHAEAAVRMFAICSVIALLMLLAAQIVWLAGYDLVNRWRALEKEEEVARAALNSAGRTPPPNPTAAPTGTDTTVKVESDDRENRRIQKDALMHLIERWWNRFGINLEDKPQSAASPTPTPVVATAATPFTPPATMPTVSVTRAEASAAATAPAEDSPPPTLETAPTEPAGSPPSEDNGDADQQKKIGTLVAVETEVNIIQTYVLPLLYGLLGSCAYVLRQLTLEIRARTFRRELGISYWLHIFLGVLAGLAIGWFLRPEVGDNGLIRGLTPFALSFLAGYSVEVLFAMMDRLVAAFAPAVPKP